MRAYQRSPVVEAVRCGSVGRPAAWLPTALLLAALSLTASGCGGVKAPPPEGRVAIEAVASWYQQYIVDHGHRPPPDEQAFVAYVQGALEARGVTFDSDQLLTSPRDGQRYVILYGEANSKDPERCVAAYEQEGYDGKKLVAFASARSQEADDAQLQSLLAAE